MIATSMWTVCEIMLIVEMEGVMDKRTPESREYSKSVRGLMDAAEAGRGLVALSGVLIVNPNQSAGATAWRLYRDSALSEWWEVDKEHIKAFCAPNGLKFGIGPSTLWVDAEATIRTGGHHSPWVEFLAHAHPAWHRHHDDCCFICTGPISTPGDVVDEGESYPGPC